MSNYVLSLQGLKIQFKGTISIGTLMYSNTCSYGIVPFFRLRNTPKKTFKMYLKCLKASGTLEIANRKETKKMAKKQGKNQELSGLLSVLEDVQNSVISKIGSEFPKSTIVVAREEKGRKHGHFTTLETWKNNDVLRHEIFLSAESLSRGAKETLGTLLHEMAHAYNHANKIEDTSGDGYHNKKFQSTAERIFNLKIEKIKGAGFSKTSVPDEAIKRWSKELSKIEDALKLHALSLGNVSKGRNKNGLKATCQCGEIIRLSQKAFDLCRPMCQNCNSEFVTE